MKSPRSWFVMLLLLVLAIFGVSGFAADPVPAADLDKIKKAAPSEASVDGKPGRCLLIFTLAKGFIHKSTPWGVEALRIMGEKTGAFTTVHSEDPAVFTRESLARFDAVCFLNTCYTPFDDAELKANFMEFVRGGKGYVGIHCSAHTFLDWSEFGRMQGGYSVSHPWHEGVTVAIEEPNHPLMQPFAGDSFRVTDEIYEFDDLYSREKLRVLASLDTDRTNMAKPGIVRQDGDFGLVWIRDFAQGRVFYSAFGHDQHVFWDPLILRHYLAGIQFAFGDLPADATPSAQLPGYRPKPVPAGAEVPSVLTDDPWLALTHYRYEGSRLPLSKITGLVRQAMADPHERHEMEARLLSHLVSESATVAAKEFLCGQLRLVGSESSVPALARLLPDDRLNLAARMALQRNPSPAAGRALRGALENTAGNMLIGVMDSLADRRDRGAVLRISLLASDPNPEIAVAAISALGKIGGGEAAGKLEACFANSPGPAFPEEIAESLLLCADGLVRDGQRAQALLIYHRLLEGPNTPRAGRLAALAGLLKHDREHGRDIALEILRGKDSDLQAVAISQLKHWEGEVVTKAMESLLPRVSVPVQVPLVAALADRRDLTARTALIKASWYPEPEVRLTALAGLGEVEGDAEVVFQLLQAASAGSGKEPTVARESLARLRGVNVEPALITYGVFLYSKALRVEAVRAMGDRGMVTAAEELVSILNTQEPAVRIAAWQALSKVAGANCYQSLIDRWMAIRHSAERTEAERAVLSLARQIESREARDQPLITAFQSAAEEAVPSLLSVLSSLGGAAALELVRAAGSSANPVLKKAAVHALAQWPDPAVLDDLLVIAEHSADHHQRIVALRGYLRLIGLPAPQCPMEIKVDQYRQGLTLATRLEERKLALAGLAALAHPEALRLAESCEGIPGLATEAKRAAEKIRSALSRP